MTSFYLFLNNSLQNGAQAYTNMTGLLYPMNTKGSQNGYVWAAPQKGWIYDSSVSGACIPSGVYTTSGQFLTRASGIVIDFNNGRVISPYNWGPLLSGGYSVPNYNLYISDESTTNFWLDQVFNSNPNVAYKATGAPDTPFFAPCIILTNANDRNDPFAFGGLDQTRNTIRTYIISNNGFNQEGAQSWIRDLARTYFALAPFGAAPLIVPSGDIKGSDFNYQTGICQTYGLTPGVYIEAIHGFKLSQRASDTVTFQASVMEVDTNTLRQPRANQT